MSDKSEKTAKADKKLARIEEALTKLAEVQSEVCGHVAKLADRVEALALSSSSPRAGAPSTDEVVKYLDQFRAAESLGEASVGAWIAVSNTACLRGGLRTVQQREGMHARLLEARIKELGGSPQFEIPETVYQQAMEESGSRAKSDGAKLLAFTSRFPDADTALEPLFEMADRLDHDPETQSLLRTIAQDERSTLEFLQGACELLNS